mmetsp:Transcript_2818/g.5784  ORF Transcript_2818/g.5784 Transcript_2818/m.5784 type:complete len:224 (+) Transcript_2818:102-773(+)
MRTFCRLAVSMAPMRFTWRVARHPWLVPRSQPSPLGLQRLLLPLQDRRREPVRPPTRRRHRSRLPTAELIKSALLCGARAAWMPRSASVQVSQWWLCALVRHCSAASPPSKCTSCTADASSKRTAQPWRQAAFLTVTCCEWPAAQCRRLPLRRRQHLPPHPRRRQQVRRCQWRGDRAQTRWPPFSEGKTPRQWRLPWRTWRGPSPLPELHPRRWRCGWRRRSE